jgi:Protein of unknown function (DUF3987)
MGIMTISIDKKGSIFQESDPLTRVTAVEVGPEIAGVLGLQTIEPAFDDWPFPEPLSDDLPDVMQFDLELMPASLRPLVQDVAERMQVPLDFPAITAMATLAGVTNRRATIQPKRNDDTWIVVPNLWGGIIASPGMKKSPLISSITKPVHDIESELRTAHQLREGDYQVESELYAAEIKAWDALFQRAAKSNKERPPKPQSTITPPVPKRLLTSDGTFESLHHLMSENAAGLFVLRDELTGWLAGLERHGREQERSFFLECWNGDSPFTIDRIGRGSIHVPHCCLSLFGGIQPARLRHYMADALREGPSNDGLIQRFQLLVWPDQPKEYTYLDCKPDAQALQRAAEVYRRIALLSAERPLRLRFNNEAQTIFEQWLTQLELRLRSGELSPHLEAHLSKYRSLMPSLALLLALADGHTEVVPAHHARLAADWCTYLESHANRVYACQSKPERSGAIALSKKLARGWMREEGVFTLRDVYRKAWSGLDTPEAARAALQILEEYGWVRRESATSTQPNQAGGRPSEIFFRNPRIEERNAGKSVLAGLDAAASDRF